MTVLKFLRKITLLLALAIVPACCYAVPDFEDSDPETEDVPIDGGISLLVAAGAAYGVKKISKLQQNKK